MSKYGQLLGILEDAPYGKIVLDGRHPDVELPRYLWEDAVVILTIGFGLAVPIPDLQIDPLRGVSGTFSFQRQPHYCAVPWPAIYGFGCEHGQLRLIESEVPEVARERFALADRDTSPGMPAVKSGLRSRVRRNPLLRLILGGREDPPPGAA